MIKVLHLLNTSSYSGAENVAITIIENMPENIHSCYASFDGQIRSKLNHSNIEFRSIKRLSIFEVRRLIKEFNPNIIHAHDFRTSVVSAFSTFKVPILSHLHNNAPWLKSINKFSIIYLISSINFKRIVCVSDSISKEYIFSKYMKKKILTISNPIDVNMIKEKSKENSCFNKIYDVAFIGRLSKPKNPIEFIYIIEKLKLKKSKISAIMIGDGDMRIECGNLIRQHNLEQNIDLVGFIDNPFPILSNSKVLCMTSIWEGFGLVAIEALSLGIPVVAKPVGGLVDIVTNDCGKLTSNYDELISEIELLLENTDYRLGKSVNALRQSMKFSNISEFICRLINIYMELI